jgi:esterase/lipase superfamily enzyme
MLMVSCRKDFWSPTDFSAANAIRRIELTAGTGTDVSSNEFVQELLGKRIVVLVHGYNNDESDVVDSYRTIDAHMRLLGFVDHEHAPYDALVGFVWPGGALGVSFPFARQRASETAMPFHTLLTTLRAAGTTIDLNAHSLGTQVALEALRMADTRLLRHSWNFAAAIDNESIESGERYFDASQRCDRFYVFHSKNDARLRFWYRVGDFFDFDIALGYSGPEDPGTIINSSKHVRVINCKDVVQSHSAYRYSGEVWSYMARELKTPTTEQFVKLQRRPEALTAAFNAAQLPSA